jgi:biotin carboxyl carrier protein
MHYEVEVNGRVRQVGLTRSGGGFAVEVDGRRRHVNAAAIDAHTLSVLVGEVMPEGDSRPGLQGRCASQEVAIWRSVASGAWTVHVGSSPVAVVLNGRRRRKADGSHGGADRGARGEDRSRRLVASMPGKVIRVLVGAGDAVQARQPLVVVEAMKMENELRAGRDGYVAAIHVREGVSVEAGALLIELK